MTIAVQTPRSGPYSGDGATVAFAYGFLIDDEDEIVVVVADADGNETTQTITTHYTVSGVGSNSGGTVTFVTAPAATETVSMRRATVLDQGLDLQNRGSVVPQVLENTYDEVVKMAQDLQEQIDRAILLRVTANTTGIDVPAPSAGKLLGWNAAADNLQNYTPNSGSYITTPGSVTDNRVVRFDGTTGEAFQESGVTIDDNASISMSTINIDNLNTRIGIGDVSPDTDLDIFTAAPTIRLQDSGDSAIADLIATSPKLLLDIDAAAAVASSAFQIDIDNGQRLLLDEDGMVIGTGAADRALRLSGTDAIKIPVGTTAQRPGTPEQGDIRRNTTTTQWEGYDGSSWGSLAGPKHFDGAGDTSNQATAFQAFINTLVAGDIVDLQGQTIYLGSTITISTSNIKLMNGTFVVHSDMLSTSSVFRVVGTAASAIALTGTAGRSNFTLTMASTASLSKDQLVLLYSDDLYARRSSAEVNSSELCYIREITSGTVVTVYQPFAQDYTTGDNAEIIPITPVKDVTFDRITIDGTANDANMGIEVLYGQNVEVNNCVLLDLFNRGVEFQTSYACTVRDCIIQVDGGTAMYGVAIIDGSRSIQVISNTFHRCRHGVSHGGGYVNRDCWIAYNGVYGATNAGLDAHSGADNVHFHSNSIYVEGSDGTNDGIVYQGTNGKITDNSIYGTVRNGIYYQSMAYVATDDRDSTVTIRGNTINTDVCQSAIQVEPDNNPTSPEVTAELSNIVIAENNCTNRVEFTGSVIRVYGSGASMRNITILGNTIRRAGKTASDHGIEVRALTGYAAQHLSITGNTIYGEEGTLADGVNLNGADANSVRFGAVTGNVIRSCDTGVNGTNTRDFIVAANSVSGDATADFSMGANDTVTANHT